MKTTVDFENEIVESFSKYFNEYTLTNKIPKKNCYVFNVEKENNQQYVLKKIYEKGFSIDINYKITQEILNKSNKNFLLEELIKTSEDTTNITVNEHTYVAFKNITCEKLFFDNDDNIKLYFSALHNIHKVILNIPLDEQFLNIKPTNFDLEKYKINFAKLKKQVQNNKKKSDFDFLFLKNYEKYNNLITDIENKLNSFESYKKPTYTFIYNNDSVFQNKNIPVIKTPTTFTVGYYLVDIYNFIIKYLKKVNITEIKNYSEILMYYNSEILDSEKEILKLLLQYPFKYIDIMVQYYEKKRSFVPASTNADIQDFLILDKKIQKLLNT